MCADFDRTLRVSSSRQLSRRTDCGQANRTTRQIVCAAS